MPLDLEHDEAVTLLHLLRNEYQSWKNDLTRKPESEFAKRKVAHLNGLLEKVWNIVR